MRRPPRGLLVLPLILSTGCGRYADFTLPAPAGRPAEVVYRWEARPEPVLARGGQGSWDGVDALNPSVVKSGSTYFSFYSGFDGHTWRTGLATSTDGVAWTKQGQVLAPDPSGWEGDYIAANGAAVSADGKWMYWYQAGKPPRIGLAFSDDGRAWRKQAQPVLALGPRGSWDERGVGDPYVIRAGDGYYMFYLGQDRARRQRLGVARSRDGVRWEKLRANPVLELGEAQSFDENGLGEPAVWSAYGSYWMLYTGRDRGERRRLGLARSPDGVRWARVSAAPVLAGGAAWNSQVVCDPSVVVEGDTVRVWFGGGDRARPDENLNGQIGLASGRADSANLSK
jgi:predicted GH43/DUF377 family glycosyl hydrolase